MCGVLYHIYVYLVLVGGSVFWAKLPLVSMLPLCLYFPRSQNFVFYRPNANQNLSFLCLFKFKFVQMNLLHKGKSYTSHLPIME